MFSMCVKTIAKVAENLLSEGDKDAIKSLTNFHSCQIKHYEMITHLKILLFNIFFDEGQHLLLDLT